MGVHVYVRTPLNSKIIVINKFNVKNKFIQDLPLYFHVLKGDLSLVGTLLTKSNESDPKIMIKPGITGLSKQKIT